GAGNYGQAIFSPTIEGFIGNSTTLNIGTGNVSVKATAQPQTDADAIGVSVAGVVQMGYSEALAKVAPTVNAFIGKNSQITASNLTVLAQQILPTRGYTADAYGSGSGGALWGSVNATVSTAKNQGQLSAYIGNNSTLNITNALSITADADSTQNSYADGYNAGILAGGANLAYAETNITTQTYIGSGITIKAGSLAIDASGGSDNFADSQAGGGGIVSGRAAQSESTNISTSKVYLNYDPTKADNSNNSTTTIKANTVSITGEQTTTFNSRADAINASVVGGSGAAAKNTIDSTVNVNLGSYVNLTTKDLKVNANNTIAQSTLNDQNAEAGSGGIIDGSAVVVDTTISNETKIIVGNGTFLTVNGSSVNPGDFKLTATNNISADEDAKIETGGIVPVAGADTTIKNNKNIAQIEIGAAELSSVGDIDLSTIINANIDAYAKAKVWGLAGGPIGSSLAELTGTNEIDLLSGAKISAGRDANLRAGKLNNGNWNNININADTYLFNGTAATGVTPEAQANLTLNNKIKVGSNSTIESVRNTNLDTVKGTTSVNAEGIGQSSLGTAVEAISSVFGADVSTKISSGHTSENVTSGVQIDGTITAGTKNKASLTINSDGIDRNNIDAPSLVSLNLGSEILSQISSLDAQIASTNDQGAITALKDQKTALQAMLQSFGAEANGYATFLSIPDVYVSSGNIQVTSDYVTGSGAMEAKADTSIAIRNEGNLNLLLNNLIIDDNSGGQVLFNNGSVTNNSNINVRNFHTSSTANFASIITNASANSQLTVSNNNTAAPIILVANNGSLENLNGTLSLSNTYGSIGVLGNLEAKTIDINAGNNFFLNSSGMFNTGGNPEAVFKDLIKYTEGLQIPSFTPEASIQLLGTAPNYGGYAFTHGGDSTSQNAAINTTIKNSTTDETLYQQGLANQTSQIVASNNIVINASQLNINGLVQSGISDYTLNLDSSLNSIISTFGTAYSSNSSKPSNLYSHNGHVYFLSNAGSWEAAQVQAELWGGDLVTVNDASEQSWLMSTFGGSQNLWIGYTDRLTEGTFAWMSGDTSTYTNWGTGEPNNYGGAENYAALRTDGKWNDASNNQSYRGIIEISSSVLPNSISSKLNLTPYLSKSNNITAYYNAQTNQIEMDDVKVRGGYVYLSGEIMSTGNGKIKAMDGYGKINIQNQTNYQLQLNQLDTGGEGIDGKVVIVDKKKGTTTTYTNNGSRTASYTPADSTYLYSDRRNVYNLYMDLELQETLNKWSDFTLVGQRTQDKSYSYVSDSSSLGLNGVTNANYAFQLAGEAISNNFTYSSDSYTFKYNGSTYVYTHPQGRIQGTFEIEERLRHYFKGNYNIGIEFIGYDTGAINVTSAKNILVNGSITNNTGTTTLTSTNGAIKQSNNSAEIISKDVVLSANTGIGTSDSNIKTDLQGGNITATTASGDLNISETDGDLTFTTIKATSGNVNLTAENDLLAANSTSSITGRKVSLTATTGNVGSTNSLLAIDSGTDAVNGGLSASAAGNINLNETTGDLYLINATSKGGDVTIKVANGKILDYNSTEEEDTAAKQAILQAVWEDLRLTSDYGAQDSIDAAIAAYERAQEYLYKIYWQDRNLTQNADGSYTADAYNPNATYTLTDSETAHLTAYGYANYQALHTALASKGLTTSYNANYSYTANSSEIANLSQGGIWSEAALKNTFSAGLFLPISDTETTIEADNITAQDLNLTAQGIGQQSGTTILDMAAIKAQGGATEAQLLAFLTAERNDITYYDRNGIEITTPLSDLSNVGKMAIASVEDVDVTATGALTVNSTGDVFLGSEDDLSINQVKASGYQVRIKTGAGIYNSDNTGTVTNITANSAILEAGGSSLGTSAAPLLTQLGDVAVYNNKLYFLTDNLTWTQAETKAQQLGGHLVTINNAAEEQWLQQTFGTSQQYWIGLTDKATLGQFPQWANGESLSYTNWAPGEPGNGDGQQHGVVMNYTNSKKWDDTAATLSHKGIIELDLHEYNGHLYLLTGSQTWNSAETLAQSIGGNLAAINNTAEEQWLQQTFGTSQQYWIGLTDKVTLGQFPQWTNGESLSYTNWAPGEPGDGDGKPHGVVINYTNNKKWDDTATTNSYKGIIELDNYVGTLTARANNNIYIHQINQNPLDVDEAYAGDAINISSAKDMSVGQIYGVSSVTLNSGGTITDIYSDTANNIQSKAIALSSGGNIGTASDEVEIYLDSVGSLTVNTGHDIYVRNLSTDDALNVNFLGHAGTLTNSAVVDTTSGSTIDYSSFKSVNVNFGSGTNTFAVTSLGATKTANLYSSSGTDTFQIGNSNLVNASQIAGSLGIHGGTGTTTLLLNNSADTTANTVTVTDTEINAFGLKPIAYTDVDAIAIYTGSAKDSFTVNSVQANTALMLDGSQGEDILTLKDLSTTNRTIKVTNTQVTGLWNSIINYSSIENLNLNTNNATNTVGVESLGSSTNLNLTGGTGTNTFDLGYYQNVEFKRVVIGSEADSTIFNTGSLDRILGKVNVYGGAGQTNLIVNDGADLTTAPVTNSTSNGSYQIMLQGVAAGQDVTVTDSNLLGLATQGIYYQNIDQLNIVTTGVVRANTTASFKIDSVAAGTTLNIDSLFNRAKTLNPKVYTSDPDFAADARNYFIGSATNDLSNIKGTVNIAFDEATLNVYDTANSTGHTYNLSNGVLSGFNATSKIGVNDNKLNLYTGSGNDQFDLNFSKQIQVYSGAGDDTFVMRSLSGGGTINGGLGNDTYRFGVGTTLDSLSINASIIDDGGTSDRFILDDTAYTGSRTFVVKSNSMSYVSNYSGIENIQLNMGSGNDYVYVPSLDAITKLDINMNGGDDLILVGGDQYASISTQNSRAVLGTISVDGGSGNNSLWISDIDYFNSNRSKSDDTIRVTNTSISGLSSNPVKYSKFQQLIVGSGEGADTLIVESIAADTSLELRDWGVSSQAKTTVNIGDPQARTIENILGEISISQLSGSNDELIVNAAADTTNRTINIDTTFNNTKIQGITGKGLKGANQAENIVINTGAGQDAISINSLTSYTQSLTLITGAGADTVNVTGLGGTLVLSINTQEGDDRVTVAELSGVTQLTVDTGSGNDNVTLSATTGSTKAVVNTGDDNDRVNIASLSPFSQLTIKAGAGDDTIAATTATGTTGIVALNGEAGNDSVDASLLTTGVVINGDDGNDTIQGGQGNDLIGGGAGSDTIYGNQGSDEIYGDSTFPATASDAKYTGFTFPSKIELFTNSRPVPTSAVTSGDDKLYGGDGEDVIYGEGGNDAIATGNGSKEVVFGGAGDDAIDARNSDGSNDSYKLIDGGTGTNTLQQNFTLLSPEIAITDSNNTALSNGATSDFGLIAVDSSVGTTTTSQKTYTIRNTGVNTLSFTGASISGTNASNFAIIGKIPTQLAVGASTTITVQFDPSEIGYHTATLSLLNNDSNESPYTINLLGKGLVSGKGMYVSRSDKTVISDDADYSVNFSSTAVGGSSSTQTIELANYGTEALNIPVYQIIPRSGSYDFSFVQAPTTLRSGSYPYGDGFTLNMGEKVTFTISYTRSKTGNSFSNFVIKEGNDLFFIDLSGTSTTRTVSLTQGTTAVGEFDTLSFGSVFADSGSITKTFTLTNVTSSSLSLTNPKIGGTAASDFTLDTSTLPTQLAAGGSASFKVTFDPKLVGDRTASLSLYNYALTLSGTGTETSSTQSQTATLTDGTTTVTGNSFLQFGNVEVGQTAVTKTLTLTNASNTAWDLDQIYIYGLNQNFTLVGNVPKGTLASGASTTFTVQYAPLNSGEHTATLTLYSKQFSENPFTYQLYGFSPYIPAIALDNAVTTLSEFADTTNRVKVADLNITYGGSNPYTVSLSGVDANKFEVINKQLYLKAGTVLDYETQKSLQVTVAVDEPTVGKTPDSTQNLVIAIADSNEAPTLALQSKVASLAENTDTANRVKVADITIDDVLGTNTFSLSGADANLFEIVDNAVYLKAGAALDYETKPSLQVTVAVDDTTVGTTPDSTQNLVIAIANVNEAPTLTLQNQVVSLAENTNTSNRVKVADIAIADDVLGTNTLSLTGTDADKFEILGNELYLKAGTVLDYETKTSLNVTVAIDDITVGTTPDAVATLTLAMTDVNELPEINIKQGTVDLTNGATFNFGSFNVTNGVVETKFTVENTGKAVLNIANIKISGLNAGDFMLVGNIPTGTLAIGATATFTVRFDPSTVGTRTATLTIGNNDADEANYSISLTGIGHTISKFTSTNGDDTIYSNGGNNIINAGAGNDVVNGGSGAELVYAGDGDDVAYGGAGSDRLNGNNGRDTLYGGIGNDVLQGGNDDDRLYGDEGNDIMLGDAGNDYLDGGTGSDRLRGGTGSDTFVLRLDSINFDTILDFNVNEDKFLLMGLAPSQLSFADSGSYGLIIVGSTVIAKVYNVKAAQLKTYFNTRYQP
ncbi:choice-of-anchor D domain-containing protein, partial [Nostoc sp. FACHB-973]|nr:choice-of-anchor D domain-containing protein [Nostoc sp. FACHB-973]